MQHLNSGTNPYFHYSTNVTQNETLDCHHEHITRKKQIIRILVTLVCL